MKLVAGTALEVKQVISGCRQCTALQRTALIWKTMLSPNQRGSVTLDDACGITSSATAASIVRSILTIAEASQQHANAAGHLVASRFSACCCMRRAGQ